MPASEDPKFDIPDGIALENAEALLLQLAGAFSSTIVTADLSSEKEEITRETPVPPDVTARYRTLLEQIPAVIFMAFLDRGLSEAYVSPHIETILGFTQEEWLNDPVRWYSQIHPDDRTRWSIEAAQLILSGKSLRSVYRIIARDGHIVWFHCQVKLVLTEDGRPWFLHGAAFDITDLKQAEIALKQAHDELDVRVRDRTTELEQVNQNLQREIAERKRAEAVLAQTVEELTRSNADLRQFAYSASHDLQEPLRNVANYSEWLKVRYQGKLDATADQFLDFLTDGAQRMISMIRDLLAYTKVANEAQERNEVTDATVTLAKVTADLQKLILDNRAVITHGPLPMLAVREVHLRQLFQNLIANAIKYRSDVPPCIHISATASDGYCLFSLADNGVGIASQFHQKIFGIFTRLEDRGECSGTGIGLAICKRIVERYGGRIWVDSEPKHGATFYFKVPLACSTRQPPNYFG
ncbi:MAG TPA: ATP-binding protein [Bryobacteraceae bacterium]|jgi:PAS domain S-box-containing protein|nr:ATP-binding protein [Bryobacteraceae bacterium]